jgi:hypothetical protein
MGLDWWGSFDSFCLCSFESSEAVWRSSSVLSPMRVWRQCCGLKWCPDWCNVKRQEAWVGFKLCVCSRDSYSKRTQIHSGWTISHFRIAGDSSLHCARGAYRIGNHQYHHATGDSAPCSFVSCPKRWGHLIVFLVRTTLSLGLRTMMRDSQVH